MTLATTMERTYLFVPPEENAEARALGAHWDGDSKRWYIDVKQPSATFARWLPDARSDESEDDEAFEIVSSQARVAVATAVCQQCHAQIEVICIHCESGSVEGEALEEFTVSHVSEMDEALARQLRPWPHYRRTDVSGAEEFANHCPHCGGAQDDLMLHTEPDQAFFDIPGAPPGSIRLIPVEGTVRLSGDEHFGVG